MASKAKKDPYDHTATERSARRSARIADAGGAAVLVRFQDADELSKIDRVVDAGVGTSRADAIMNLVREKAAKLTADKAKALT